MAKKVIRLTESQLKEIINDKLAQSYGGDSHSYPHGSGQWNTTEGKENIHDLIEVKIGHTNIMITNKEGGFGGKSELMIKIKDIPILIDKLQRVTQNIFTDSKMPYDIHPNDDHRNEI